VPTFEIVTAEDRRIMQYLVEHFEIPPPKDVAEMAPERYAWALALVRAVVARYDPDRAVFNHNFLDAFQVDDTARLLMKSGGINAWKQGLGKTVGSMLYAKAAADSDRFHTLIVVPQDLVPQWEATANGMFLTNLRKIAGVRDALACRSHIRAGATSSVWITWYEALSQAGKIEEMQEVIWQKETDESGKKAWRPHALGRRVPLSDPGDSILLERKGETFRRSLVSLLQCPRCGQTMKALEGWPRDKAGRDLLARFDHAATAVFLTRRQHGAYKGAPTRNVAWRWRSFAGSTHPRPVESYCERCGYVHWRRRLKPAYYYLRDLFDLVIVDEGTKIKNMDSQMSQAVQGLRARHRLLLTGTPIKNYVPDLFALMWWALGDNTPRFPFSREGGRAKFNKDFAVIEHKVDGRGKRFGSPKVLPKLCNPIALWRLLNANTIRRTKASIGVPLVPCRWHDLRAPFGARQARVYQMWLEHFDAWFMQKHPEAGISDYPDLIMRNAAMLGMFAKLQFACTMPCAEPDRWAEQYVGAASNFTPKNVAVIRKALELASAGRKVVIFSAVKEHSAWVAESLNRFDVQALSIVERKDGRSVTLGPKGRAHLIRDFIDGDAQVLCASIQAMNLGHNLDVASAVIMNGLPWDFASFDQAINRVHRITSREPVDVFIAQVVCNERTNDFRHGASLDQKMTDLIKQKGETESLALDGQAPEIDENQIDIGKFLKEVADAWRAPADVLDEQALERALLQAAAA